MKLCIVCKKDFGPTPHQIRKSEFTCPPCRRGKQKIWRDNRRENGNPVVSFRMPADYQSQYAKQYSQKPEVRARKRAEQKARYRNPDHAERLAARRLIRDAVRKNLISKMPCFICENPMSEAHHEDYSMPLDVIWFCRKHHNEHHARAKGLPNV